jgi:transcriptional regulator with XRE-family HTH domain
MVTTAGPYGGPVQSVIAPPGSGSPTVLRILLGAQLRRLREAKRLSLEEAGNVIRASHSKISRLETGRVGFKDRDIVDLLTFYGVTDEKEREALRSLAARANSPGWWHDYADVLPSWFEPYVGLEEAASQIRAYEVQFIPGLLQTEDYARAVTMLGYSNPKEINRRVSLRLARQVILDRPEPPSLWVVLDEATLRRPIGGVSAMRTQLKHLIDISQRPNVSIQVIPFKAGGHAAAGGPFSLLRFAEYDIPDVVYLEQLTTAQYLDKQDVVDGYLAVMERLCIDAQTPATSVKTLKAILRGELFLAIRPAENCVSAPLSTPIASWSPRIVTPIPQSQSCVRPASTPGPISRAVARSSTTSARSGSVSRASQSWVMA